MAAQLEKPDLVFVHLSDIHFREGITGDVHDEGEVLRNELQLDLRRLRARLPKLDGLLVSGDIAYGAKPEEYEYAGNWIESIRELLGCSREGVMVTPGNHDIDRTSIPMNGEVDLLHETIRSAAPAQRRDEVLAEILRDPMRGERLLSPLSTYNSFAAGYGCQVDRTRPYWERNFPLGDGTSMRFRGITTTLLSSGRDDEHTHRMLYGGAQRAVLRTPNVRYAIIGHHPPSWTLEGDNADHVFSTMASLQVYGHKHEQWLTRIGNCVRIIAGAVHPARHEQNWLPRYSAIAIAVIDDRHLAFRIYPREWSAEELTFIPDYNLAGHDHREYTVDVEPRQA